MKTRTLLLMSFVCGLAIIGAGAAMLLRVSGQTQAEPTPVGVSALVGDMSITVNAAVAPGEDVRSPRMGWMVRVTLSGAIDDAPAEDFRLLVDGEAFAPVGDDCPAVNVVAMTCTVTFREGLAVESLPLLLYRRGDQRAVWQLR